MQNRSRKTEDVNQAAFRVVQQATGQVTATKDPAAVSLGRRGGLKGGKARAAKLTTEELSAHGRKAALARWGKKPKAKVRKKG